jgi:hypothetical protein
MPPKNAGRVLVVDRGREGNSSGALGKIDVTFSNGSKHQYITGLAHDSKGWCLAAIDETGN